MSTVTRNIIANYTGRIWTGLISLVFVPLYIKFLGIEAYGLIGIYLSLMALLSVLDMGLSATLSRQLACLSASQDTGQEARNLVRTMEVIYWGIGILIGAGISVLAPVLARHWVNVPASSVATVEKAVIIMGFVAAFEWPGALYTGGLMGLQRQVHLNGIRAVMATLQSVGAVLILWLVSPTIIAFFKWQILISTLQTFLLARGLWDALPPTGEGSAFRRELVIKNWRFAAGMTGISVMVAVLTQLDKIILSKMLTLEMFGYYMLAFNVAGALTLLVNPIFSALFPRFSQMVVEKTEEELSSLYHRGCQLLSLIVLPVALTLAFFSKEVLTLWIGNPVTVGHTHFLLSLILIGTTMNALMTLPYALQLAFGWTKLVFFQNFISIIILVPSLILMINSYGSTGAAIVWIILNLGYITIMIPIMHRHLLRKEMWKWYLVDIGTPITIIIFITAISKTLMPIWFSNYINLFWIMLTLLFSLLMSSLSLKSLRKDLRHFTHQVVGTLRKNN